MGNDPGRPLTKGQRSKIVIRVSGPLEKKHARAFKSALQAVVKRYRPLTKGLTVSVKKKTTKKKKSR
jgi:hypothetical protein